MADLAGAVERNIHRGADVPASAGQHLEQGLRALWAVLSGRDLAAILTGDIA